MISKEALEQRAKDRTIVRVINKSEQFQNRPVPGQQQPEPQKEVPKQK
jgi:hypothetical protein